MRFVRWLGVTTLIEHPVLSVVDESIFLETKSNKRILHFRSTKFPARTLQDPELVPDTLSVDEFNLQSHINLLAETIQSASEYSL